MYRRWGLATALIGSVILMGVGCSRLDFSREMFHNPLADVFDSGKPYVPEQAAGSPAERKAKFEAVLTKWQEGRAGQGKRDYVLGAGDVLSVSVFALEAPDRTSVFDRTIGKDGTITLPWTDPIQAKGLTARQFEEAIKDVYRDKYLKNPQVTVNIDEHKSIEVVMTGAVSSPGVYHLTENTSTVLEMIAMAGGLTDEAAGEVLIVRAKEDVSVKRPVLALKDGIGGADDEAASSEPAAVSGIPIDLNRLIGGSDLQQNVEIGGGDIVSVRSSRRQYVYVLGYVARPGAYELRGAQKMDALRAVAMAGGLAAQGRADRASLLRQENNRQKVIPVDLIKMARGVRPVLNLEAGDTLIVGTSFLARATEIVRPTISAGASAVPSLP